MNWKAMAVFIIGGLVLIVLTMVYSGMFVHGD